MNCVFIKRGKRFDHKNTQREDDHVMGEGQIEGMPENNRDCQLIPKTRQPKA